MTTAPVVGTKARTAPQLVVQVIDDAPDALGFLIDALEAAGYSVLVARSGEAALESLQWVTPDAILLDAMMPGLDGFETCRRIKQLPERAHIPIIFMTALSETAHIVTAFDMGGVDYVVKPVKIDEVLARLSAHMRNARVSRLAREAVDVAGLGVLMLDSQFRVAWQSPKAAAWLKEFVAPGSPVDLFKALVSGLEASGSTTLPLGQRGGEELVMHWIGSSGLGESMTLLQLRPAAASRVRSADLTRREAEVLSWLAKGKTNRDIADILGMSPRTVNKHLEHVYAKLGVETRTSAAAVLSLELDYLSPSRSEAAASPVLARHYS
ncbi:MAG: response regulator [Polaromonas sp.]|uniref:response regulator n=1 Tax=Polaromonas sp. TaxID=1869339 RepID=UPI0027316CE9|nr:response regulator [Polaromonas sp.]MDP2255631.1 response regulator [Polaromonas sp.]MDP3707795.1 response regulator [Polaromonas sp.]